MYSINLNQIAVDPKIEEANKTFENETKSGVVMLAVNYISLNYKDKYDPKVLELRCSQAVLHDGVPEEVESHERPGNINA